MGGFFTGVFYRETTDELSAIAGGVAYKALGRMVLGIQSGFVGGGTSDLGIYGLVDGGYALRVRHGHQAYILGGLGATNTPNRSVLFNAAVGLDFIVFPNVGRPRQEGYVFGVRIGSHLTPSDGLAGIYVQATIFGGGRRSGGQMR